MIDIQITTVLSHDLDYKLVSLNSFIKHASSAYTCLKRGVPYLRQWQDVIKTLECIDIYSIPADRFLLMVNDNYRIINIVLLANNVVLEREQNVLRINECILRLLTRGIISGRHNVYPDNLVPHLYVIYLNNICRYWSPETWQRFKANENSILPESLVCPVTSLPLIEACWDGGKFIFSFELPCDDKISEKAYRYMDITSSWGPEFSRLVKFRDET